MPAAMPMAGKPHARERRHYLNAIPLQDIYRRWFDPQAAGWAAGMLRLRTNVEGKATGEESTRLSVDIALDVRIGGKPAAVFKALTVDADGWWGHPMLRPQATGLTLAPQLGGLFIEHWGHDGAVLAVVTQLAKDRHLELTAKRLELFKQMLPAVERLTVLSDSLSVDQLKEVEVANTSMRFKLQPLELRNSPYDIGSALSAAMRSHAEALFVLESAFIFRERMQIAQLALKNRLPTSFAFREYVDAGGLMAYGANFVDMSGLAAGYIDKILRGAKPAELPVQQPTKFELVINLKTAKALGLTVPPSLLSRADDVIQ